MKVVRCFNLTQKWRIFKAFLHGRRTHTRNLFRQAGVPGSSLLHDTCRRVAPSFVIMCDTLDKGLARDHPARLC